MTLVLQLEASLARQLPVSTTPEGACFDAIMGLEGVVYRSVSRRQTLALALAQERVFLKRHRGVAWGELFSSLLRGHRPVLGADNEWQACRSLNALGLSAPQVLGFGHRGWWPPARDSFVFTRELVGYQSLEDRWRNPSQTPAERHRTLTALAHFSRRFHGAGFCHRDYYLCHLWADTGTLEASVPSLLVMDLHRARRFPSLPRRYRLRDLGALLYSSFERPPGPRALLRFVRLYGNRPLRQEFEQNGAFWRQVYRRALRLQRRTDHARLRGSRVFPADVKPDALETIMARGEVLKDDPPATLLRVATPQGSALVKRYNLLGLRHRLRQSLRPRSRATRAWRAARRLLAVGLPTAEPLALFDQRKAGLRRVQYLLQEDLGSVTLADELTSRGLSASRETQLVELMRRLVLHGIEHGDTKATNFMVHDGALALVDLDACRPRFGGSRRDQVRLLKNFDADPELKARLRQRLLWPL